MMAKNRSHLRVCLRCAFALTLFVIGAPTANAQEATSSPPDTARQEPSREPLPAFELAAPAVLGSAAGSYLGFVGGVAVGWGGGDDPGLLSALLFGAAGSVLGTATTIHLASGERVSFGSAWGASVVGAFAGVGSAVLLSKLADGDGAGVLIGFVVGQGVVAGAISSGLQRK